MSTHKMTWVFRQIKIIVKWNIRKNICS